MSTMAKDRVKCWL